jgi:hypothetical protein
MHPEQLAGGIPAFTIMGNNMNNKQAAGQLLNPVRGSGIFSY